VAFIDCACLTVLVRHCTDSREQGGNSHWPGRTAPCAASLPSTAAELVWRAWHRWRSRQSHGHAAIARLARSPARGQRRVLLPDAHGHGPVTILPAEARRRAAWVWVRR